MSGYSHALSMPWAYSAGTDARFTRLVRINLAICLILGIVMPWLPLPERQAPVIEEPPRLATLVLEVKPLPAKPNPVVTTEPEPVVKSKPVVKPEPSVKKKAPPKKAVKQPLPEKSTQAKPAKPAPVKPENMARQKAEQAGLLALKDNLADMRQGTTSSNLKKITRLSQSGGQARKTERAMLTSGTTRASDGIQTAGLSRNTGGGELAAHSTTQVHSPVGNASGSTGGTDRAGRAAGRSIEEIQMVFDRNKGAIYSVYNRALRKDPTLQGKVVLQLTIAPSGKVVSCTLISSELKDPTLGQKITQRVKLFNFEPKDVSEITITYPIDFLPA